VCFYFNVPLSFAFPLLIVFCGFKLTPSLSSFVIVLLLLLSYLILLFFSLISQQSLCTHSTASGTFTEDDLRINKKGLFIANSPKQAPRPISDHHKVGVVHFSPVRLCSCCFLCLMVFSFVSSSLSLFCSSLLSIPFFSSLSNKLNLGHFSSNVTFMFHSLSLSLSLSLWPLSIRPSRTSKSWWTWAS
jgi:Ca2+/H+ antiporter